MATDFEKNLIRQIQFGSEDDAVAAVRQLTGGGADQIRDGMNFQWAWKAFCEQNPGLATDPVLLSAAAQMDMQLLQAGDKRPYQQRYEAIADELNTWCDRHQLTPASDESELDRAQAIEEMRRSRANGRDLDDPEYQWR